MITADIRREAIEKWAKYGQGGGPRNTLEHAKGRDAMLGDAKFNAKTRRRKENAVDIDNAKTLKTFK